VVLQTNTQHPIGMANTTVAVSAAVCRADGTSDCRKCRTDEPLRPGARGPKGNCPQEAAPRAIFVGIVNL
jgi:hypothetical protein